MKKLQTIFLLSIFGLFAFKMLHKEKPVLYIIGDSTVKNGNDTGKDSLWGWGSFIYRYFDTTRISVRNHAIGGRSSRTFINEGRWDKILTDLKPGDYVLMQFGHNDSSPLDDTARARGTIKGIGDESKEIYNPITKKQEVVYTYGWYMRKLINETKAKGAIPVVCSPVPRDNWKNGTLSRDTAGYPTWAKQTAASQKAFYIDIHNAIADKYDQLGEQKVNTFFPKDHTHTNREGAILNTETVVQQLKDLKNCSLRKFISK